MSKTQLKVLWVGIGVLVLMGLFPPDEYQRNVIPSGLGGDEPSRYSFILTVRDVAFCELFIQWVIVAVVTGGLIYTLKDKKKD